MIKRRNRKIERALKKCFPGWSGVFWTDSDGWHITTDAKCPENFYDLYPGMTRTEADKQIVDDIMDVVKRFLPDAKLFGYEQHGQYIEV